MKGVWVSLVVGVLVLASLFYVYSTNVMVNIVRVDIVYRGSEVGFIGSSVDLNTNPYQTVYGASNYTYPGFSTTGLKQARFQLLLLSNSSSVHQINSVQIQTVGFAIISLSPPLRTVNVPSKGAVPAIDLLIQCPFLGYHDEIDILVVVI